MAGVKKSTGWFVRLLVGTFRFFAWWSGMFVLLGGTGSACPFCGQPGCAGGPAASAFLGGIFAAIMSCWRWLARGFGTQGASPRRPPERTGER